MDIPQEIARLRDHFPLPYTYLVNGILKLAAANDSLNKEVREFVEGAYQEWKEFIKERNGKATAVKLWQNEVKKSKLYGKPTKVRDRAKVEKRQRTRR